ncbi:MAG: methyltransferase domain-containing protein, partial [Bdellovibrionales bacterium]
GLSNDLYFGERYEYGRNEVEWLMRDLKLPSSYFKGKQILEVGPGRDLSFALIMAGLGALTVGVEKYRPGWISGWHDDFIDVICRRAPEDFPDFNEVPLRHCQSLGAFDPAVIDFKQVAMEDFPADQKERFDIVCSLAVLEHVVSPEIVVKHIFNATKPGGFGLHGIDFRDHREFTTPHEFLLMSDEAFEAKAEKEGRYWFGNRLPASGFLRLWQEAGFKNIHHFCNMEIDEEYLQDFISRLRPSKSKYRNRSEEDLRAISVIYSMQR